MKIRMTTLAVLAFVMMAWTATPAMAEKLVLKAVSALPQGTRWSANFEAMIKRVNREAKDLFQINYIGGGGRVMSPFEVGNAVRTGVIHIASVPGAFYTNLLPEADSFKLLERTPQELRKTGGWDFINKLHQEKVNAYYLARQGYGIPFHLYLTKKIDTPDLTGLKIRVTPVYRAFFTQMGATVMRTKPGDVFTALERGAVDGYGWPIQGVNEMGWHEVTKYRVDPGFYNVEVNVLINLDIWKRMDGEQKAFMHKMGAWLEDLNSHNARINREEAAIQAEAGIKVIRFSKSVSEQYIKDAYAAGWAKVMKDSPVNGPALKKFFAK